MSGAGTAAGSMPFRPRGACIREWGAPAACAGRPRHVPQQEDDRRHAQHREAVEDAELHPAARPSGSAHIGAGGRGSAKRQTVRGRDPCPRPGYPCPRRKTVRQGPQTVMPGPSGERWTLNGAHSVRATPTNRRVRLLGLASNTIRDLGNAVSFAFGPHCGQTPESVGQPRVRQGRPTGT